MVFKLNGFKPPFRGAGGPEANNIGSGGPVTNIRSGGSITNGEIGVGYNFGESWPMIKWNKLTIRNIRVSKTIRYNIQKCSVLTTLFSALTFLKKDSGAIFQNV